MVTSIFSRLKRYASSDSSKDENYATEALATLLSELPGCRQHLTQDLFGIQTSDSASVKTQEYYQTNKYGGAILDLVVEDEDNFIIIEAKIDADINVYRPQDEIDAEVRDQLQKYEDCIGLPESKKISIFTLTQHRPKIRSAKYRYYNCGLGNIRWHELHRATRVYALSLEERTPERYLLEHYIQFMKEENMAGFQGFMLQDLVEIPRLIELTERLKHHRELIKAKIKVDGFKGSDEAMKTEWGRDGVFYKWSEPEKVGIFIGLWFSDDIHEFKFSQEAGPHVMVFLEIPPKHPIRKQILGSEAFKQASKTFAEGTVGYQVLLKNRPLIDSLVQEDQAIALLSFYQQ